MTDRTNSARRESRYGPRVVRPSQVEVARDGAGDVMDPEEEMDADLRDDTIVDTGNVKTQLGDDEEEEHEEEEEQQQEEEEEVDLPGPQPLNDDCIHVIRSQSHGYGGALSNHSKVMMLVSDVSTLMAEIKNGVDERGQDLDTCYREMIDMYQDGLFRQQILEDLIQQVGHGQDVIDAVTSYKDALAAKTEEYSNKTARQKYAQSEQYREFKEHVWEAYNETAMPPMTDLIPAEQGDDEDDEDEFTLGGLMMDFKCPVTMAILENPVTSKTCKHSYSKQAIQEYIASQARGNRQGVQCPRSGCDKVVTLSVLYDDKALAKRVQGYKRRLETRTESRRTQTALID